MKILFIASRFPYPALKGDQARVLNFLKYLGKGNEIYFVCTTEVKPKEKDIEVVRSLVKELYLIDLKKKEMYLRLLLTPLTLIPFEVMYFRSGEAQQIINEIIREKSIDVIFCQMIRTAPYVSGVNLPKVIDYQDAYSMNMMRRFKSERGLVKLVAFIEWQLMKFYEKRMLSHFDFITAVSEHDKKILGSDRKIKILPIGINKWEKNASRVKDRLIFTGNLRYFPNRDAVTWFTRNVFPLVRRSIKDVTLQIVGATPPGDVRTLSRFNGVEVIPNVPDIRDYIARATLAVAPMRSGSGTQFKVIEALSVGTPVLVSKTAMMGLDFLTEKSVVISDTNVKTFARKLIKLLKDEGLRKSLAKNGREEVNKYYSWSEIGRKLEKILIEAKENSR